MNPKVRLLVVVLAVDALILTGVLWWFFGRGAARGMPNVLVITCDTLRADRLHLYGHSRPTSPILDALAKESVVFDNFYANASFTPPSHGSILTGYYPNAHGVLWWNDVLLPGAQTIGEILGTPSGKEGQEGFGYRTGAFVNLDNFEQLGLTRGFEHVRSQIWFPGDDLNRDFLTWLDGERESPAGKGKPICAWLHFWDPHRPYAYRNWEYLKPNPEKSPAELEALTPKEQATYKKMLLSSQRKPLEFNETLYGSGDLGVGRDEGHYNRKQGVREKPHYVPPQKNRVLTEDDNRYLIDRYDGGVEFMDRCLGALVTGLRDRGELDNTILVITSDHGETFTERDDEWFTHDPHLYNEVTHVPCLIRFPKGEFGGQRIARLSQSVDLTPTILDYLGLGWKGLHGVSLLPSVEGKRQESSPAFCQTQDKVPESDGTAKYVLANRKYSLRNDTHRVIAWGAGDGAWSKIELYDLTNDPRETKDLYTPNNAAAAPLLTYLRNWLDATPPLHVSSRELSDQERSMLPGYVDPGPGKGRGGK